jgi:hypothetical protein
VYSFEKKVTVVTNENIIKNKISSWENKIKKLEDKKRFVEAERIKKTKIEPFKLQLEQIQNSSGKTDDLKLSIAPFRKLENKNLVASLKASNTEKIEEINTKK